MTKPDTNLRIVNVMDPVMCLRCPSAHIAEVLFTDGSTRKMFYCSRKPRKIAVSECDGLIVFPSSFVCYWH